MELPSLSVQGGAGVVARKREYVDYYEKRYVGYFIFILVSLTRLMMNDGLLRT